MLWYPESVSPATYANAPVPRLSTLRHVYPLLPSQVSKIIVSALSDALDPGEFVLGGEDVQSSALELCFPRRENDEDVGVVGQAVDDEIEDAGLDGEGVELVRGIGFGVPAVYY